MESFRRFPPPHKGQDSCRESSCVVTSRGPPTPTTSQTDHRGREGRRQLVSRRTRSGRRVSCRSTPDPCIGAHSTFRGTVRQVVPRPKPDLRRVSTAYGPFDVWSGVGLTNTDFGGGWLTVSSCPRPGSRRVPTSLTTTSVHHLRTCLVLSCFLFFSLSKEGGRTRPRGGRGNEGIIGGRIYKFLEASDS